MFRAGAIEQIVPLSGIFFYIPHQMESILMTRAVPCLAIRVWWESNMQAILIIRRFHICILLYLVKFICNLKNGTFCSMPVICGYVQRGKTFEWFNVPILAEVEQGNNSPSCFSSPTINCVLFTVYIGPIVCVLVHFYW